MNISYNWLKDFINIDIDKNELSRILTDIGLEVSSVEEIENIKGGLKGLVVGEVKTCEQHPNADKLSVTTVDVGVGRLLDIVCGAPNVAAGQKVIVAQVNTILYDGDKEFKIKKSKIRGAVSEGMICAEDEIGVGTSHDGIIVLPDEVKVGTPASEYYNVEKDTVFEIDLTPNRIDGASHYGVARDIAAYFKARGDFDLHKISVDDFKPDNNNLEISVNIENKDACKRYSGVTLTNVKIKESPEWIKNRLKAIGLTPINNVVDITNYVLHETGQPLHAFDADKIKGKQIIVKTLPEGTKFVTLDEVERKLSDKDLMICNTEEPMCMAGVFGGFDSGVKENTNKIFLESAYFDSVYIRKTARRHGLSTDSSFRFERGTDPNNTIYALKRATLLIKEYADAEISSDIIDVYPEKIEDFDVTVYFKNIYRLIGEEIDKTQIIKILEALEIKIEYQDNEKLELKVPTYRVDVQREADIIEEILRIYGYNEIAISNHVNSTLSYAQKPDKEKIINIVSDLLSNNGFNEMMNNSLTKAAYYENSKIFNPNETVTLLNPLSQDLNAMRQSLLFGALEVAIYNINRKNNDIKFYEFGSTYKKHKSNSENPIDKYEETKHLALILSGKQTKENWKTNKQNTDFFYLKAYVELIFEKLGFDINKIVKEYISNEIFSEGLVYKIKNKTIVEFGSISKKLLKRFDVSQNTYYADFNWDNMLSIIPEIKITYQELPKFPAVRRDLSLLLDEKIKFDDLKNSAFKLEKKLLKEVDLFDVYQGDKIAKGKKSYAISYIIQDDNKTLTDKQVDKIMNKIQSFYQREFNAELR